MTMNKNEGVDSQALLDLSSVYFYKGNAPEEIALKDCSLLPVPGVFSALYGYQGKQDGFMAAREYAKENHFQFTVIDFVVGLDHKPSMFLKLEDLAQYDLVSFSRLSRSVVDEIRETLARCLKKEGVDPTLLDLSKPLQYLMQRPELMTALVVDPDWKHVKLFAYPALVPISPDKPLSIGSLPFRHWNAIQEATCRLNPNIHITLDAPTLTRDK